MSITSVTIIEPDTFTAQVMCETLLGCGAKEVFPFDSLEMAKEHLSKKPSDILITESRSCSEEVAYLVDWIRTSKKCLSPDIFLMLCTGECSHNVITWAKEVGFSDFLAKPFAAHNFATKIFTSHFAGVFDPPPLSHILVHEQNQGWRQCKYGLSQKQIDNLMCQGQVVIKNVEKDTLDLGTSGDVEIETIQNTISNFEDAYKTELLSDLVALEASIGKRSFKGIEKNAYKIKCLAGMFGWPLVSEAANYLYYVSLKHEQFPNIGDILDIHFETIELIFHGGMRGNDPAGQKLVQELYGILENYHKPIAT